MATERTATLSTQEALAIAPQDPASYNAGLTPLRGVTAEGVRARFGDRRMWQQEVLGDGQFDVLDLPTDHAYKPAAVLVPLVQRAAVLTLLLTQRPMHMKHHPGQISFPGGRVESSDVDAIAAALRETREEIGLLHQHIDVVGTLPPYHTVTDYAVTPVVALVRPPFDLTLDENEVADAFEVPLDFILDPANHQRRSRPWQGRMRHFYAIPYQDRFIWGATAAMLRNLYHFLRAA